MPPLTLRRLLGHDARSRGRVPLAILVTCCVAVVTVAVSGAGQRVPGLTFLQSGHWLYNSKTGTAYHVDGGTKRVDAEVRLPTPADPGSQVVQNGTSGFVLGRSTTQEFGKSDLTVQAPVDSGPDEFPVGLEAAGVAYAVKAAAGVVQRFGERQATITVGGPVGRPVTTPDGTLWLHRRDTGQLCELPTNADRVTCPVAVDARHRGVLTVVDEWPVFVNLTARTIQRLGESGLGDAAPLRDVPAGDDALVAAADVDGRIAVLDRRQHRLYLVDAGPLIDRPAAPTVAKQLPPGKYTGVESSEEAVAVVDDTRGTLDTYHSNGDRKASRKLPRDGVADHRLFRGEDSRLYVDSRNGEHMLVVDRDGDIDSVQDIGKDRPNERRKPKPPKPPEPTKPPETTPTKPEQTFRPEQKPTEQPTDRPTDRPITPDARRPGPPGEVRATAGLESAVVSWTPASGNGARVDGYQVTWRGGRRTVDGSERQVTVTGLTGGSSYVFTVRAVNRIGTGPGSSSSPVTPRESVRAADAPRRFRAIPTSEVIDLEWQRPDLNGGTLVYYEVTVAAIEPVWFQSTTTSQRFENLENGRTYTFLVRAITRTPQGRTLTGATARTRGTPSETATVPTVDITDAKQTGDREVTLTAWIDGGGEHELTCHIRWDGSSTIRNMPCLAGQENGQPVSRELVITNLPRAGAYTFWGTATNSRGTGRRARASTVTVNDGTVRVSRGADTVADKCSAPDCAKLHVLMTGFAPNTRYQMKAHSTRWPNYNPGPAWTSDDNGRIEFEDIPFDGAGQRVWITVHDIASDRQLAISNKFYWEDR